MVYNHTIQTTTFLSGILNIARVSCCCCKDDTFSFGFLPPIVLLYRYTDEYSTVGIVIQKRFTAKPGGFKPRGEILYFPTGLMHTYYVRVWRYKLNYVFFQHVTLSVCMNEWMDGFEGLFCTRPVAFGTGTHLGTEKYKEISPSQFGSKDVVGVVVPNNVILAC